MNDIATEEDEFKKNKRRGDNYTSHLHLLKDIYSLRTTNIKQAKITRKSSDEEIYIHNSTTTYSL
jgi:hypothetical protein